MEIIALLTAIAGIIATIVAWNLNPRRKIYDEIDALDRSLTEHYRQRDEALKNFNSGQLTIITNEILSLNKRRLELLARLK